MIAMVLATLCHYHWINLLPIINAFPWFFTKQRPILGLFINPIPFSILTAFVAFILIARIQSLSKNVVFNIFLILFSVWFLYDIDQERTGGLLLPILFILDLWQKKSWQRVGYSVVILVLMIAISPLIFKPFIHRLQNMVINATEEN